MKISTNVLDHIVYRLNRLVKANVIMFSKYLNQKNGYFLKFTITTSNFMVAFTS